MKHRQWVVVAAVVMAASMLTAAGFAAEPKKYGLPAEAFRSDGVPQGTVEDFQFDSSTIYPGTRRKISIYRPKQLDPKTPAPVMIFQDGHTYRDEKGQFRVPVVLDNLIHQNAVPAMVAVFINPGHKAAEDPNPPWKANNRSVEYDTLSDAYARFLLEDIWPVIEQRQPLSKIPEDRAICGISSGGICAFTVAWERPNQFRKVLSHIGSFTNIRGGNAYPAMIRKGGFKPIRVFLQDGSNDLDNQFGNWWIANQDMYAAFKFAKYDVQFVGGEGGHDGNHGGAILPESLKWLWRPTVPSPQ